MGFQKGMPRPANAGRKKGSKNKKKLLRVAELLAEKDINPVDKVLRLIEHMEPKDAAKAWLELLSYCQTKAREDESGDEMADDDDLLDQFEQVTDEALLKLVKADNEAV